MTSNVPQQRPITYVNQNYVIDAAAVAPFVGGERYAKQFYGLGVSEFGVTFQMLSLGLRKHLKLFVQYLTLNCW